MNDSFADLMPSRFYKTEDVQEQPVTVTIKSIAKEETTFGGNDKPEMVTLIKFEESDKAVIAKKDVLLYLKETFGTPSACVGQKVELFRDPDVRFGGKKVGGLRLRQPSTAANPF